MSKTNCKHLATLVIALLGLPIATGCGAQTVEGKAVADQVSQGLERRVGQRPSAVRCPQEIEARAGNKARCTIVGSDGSEIGVTVTMRDDQGKFDYTVDSKLSKPPTKRSRKR